MINTRQHLFFEREDAKARSRQENQKNVAS